MSENDLRRDEAVERARLLSVSSYDVELDLTDGSGEKPGDTTFRSRSVVRFSCTEPGASTYVDLTAVALHAATLNGRPIRVTEAAELVDAVITSGFPYDKHTNPDNNLREWSAMLVKIRGERRLGSAALDLCYVGAGRLDGYWEKDLKPYDAMAGMLVAREAGGTVTDYEGGAWPQREDRGRYVASNGLIHAAMLRVLAEARGG